MASLAVGKAVGVVAFGDGAPRVPDIHVRAATA